MAKNPRRKQYVQSRKHMARLERERRQTRLLWATAIAVIVLVVGLIVYGVLSETVLKSYQPVVVVNGDKVATRDFQALTRYNRQRLVSNAVSNFQFMQLFGDSPDVQASFASQLAQIQAQLEPTVTGNMTLDQEIGDLLIRQEAARRGITVSKEEIDRTLEEAFGFFANGTATPKPTLELAPTATLSALQHTLVPPTATPTETAIPTATNTPTATAVVEPTSTPAGPTPTDAPTPSPTPYTREGYESLYQETLTQFQGDIEFNEKDLRHLVESQIYREKVMDAVLEELGVKPEQEQVWARHILVSDGNLANIIKGRLDDGDDFILLAKEFSTDESNKNNGGDLGWFPRGVMAPPFEDAAWALEVGEISDPVQTSFGFHVIQVLGHEMRPLDQEAYDTLRQQEFDKWLADQRSSAEIDIRDYWQERVPAEPTLPPELVGFLQQLQAQQGAQPPLPAGSPTTTP